MRPERVQPRLPDPAEAALREEVERLTAELAKARAEAASLEALAHEDALTGLLNRRGFLRELCRAIAFRTRYGHPVALVVADLDRLKPINDGLGHQAGDEALRHVAAVLRRNLRASDSIGRIGGDEFAMAVWQVDEETARRKAGSLGAALAASPLRHGTEAVAVEASFGAVALNPGDSAEAALARADALMYEEKRRRRALRR